MSHKKIKFNIGDKPMDLEGIMLSEVSQTEKDKYCMISYMWKLKINKQAHRYTKQIGGYCQAGVRSRKNG